MNYLAHAYLSFKHEDILLGNLISDFVKGKKKFDYPLLIQKGITLHRNIDTFTDEHAITKAARVYFREAVGLYSGAFVDIVYDHFLAAEQIYWIEEPLQSFAANVYQVLEHHLESLPEKLQRMLPYMKSQNWLYNFQFTWGIERSFEGLTRRAVYLNNSEAAYGAFINNYHALQQLSESFLPDVKKYASQQFHQLLNI
jgi:acyl carrier protein phosphodiesterase